MAASPSSYSIFLDRLLNLAIDFPDRLPKRISFSISTNSDNSKMAREHKKGIPRTLVSLSENFSEVKSALDGFVPKFGLKSKFNLSSTLTNRWELKEVPCYDNLLYISMKFIYQISGTQKHT